MAIFALAERVNSRLKAVSAFKSVIYIIKDETTETGDTIRKINLYCVPGFIRTSFFAAWPTKFSQRRELRGQLLKVA